MNFILSLAKNNNSVAIVPFTPVVGLWQRGGKIHGSVRWNPGRPVFRSTPRASTTKPPRPGLYKCKSIKLATKLRLLSKKLRPSKDNHRGSISFRVESRPRLRELTAPVFQCF